MAFMDIELAKTFLAIAREGSFIAAAEQLHVTQTTVTARMQNLENMLACALFVRNRSGAHLTANGRHFMPYAQQIVQLWEASRRDLPLPDRPRGNLRLGCESSLWNPLMSDWLVAIQAQMPDLAVQTTVADHVQLNEQLKAGTLDLVLVHQPEYAAGLQIEHLLDEKLVMVTTPGEDLQYLYVDWGEGFRNQHDAVLPHLAHSHLRFDLGPLALQFMLTAGGRGYFRTRVVNKHLQAGRLHAVADTPEFSYPVYLIQAHADNPTAAACAALLKQLARHQHEWL